MRRVLPSVLLSVLLSGCFGSSDGVEVPVNDIYFPVGLALDEGDKHLLVISSDFDLQFNGGAIQSYDLDGIYKDLVPVLDNNESGFLESEPCKEGEQSAAERQLYPGRCKPTSPEPYRRDSVKIGAFATDAIIRQNVEGATRLYVPVRGDSTLHWLDVQNGMLECGQDANRGACDAAHRAGDDPSASSRNITLNAEPFAVDASEHGGNIVVSNQTTGTASLFTDEWATGGSGDVGPILRFALSSDRIPRRPVGVAAIPAATPGVEGDTFLMTFRDSAQVRLVRYASDDGSTNPRPFLVDGGGVGITANSVGTDSRGIAVDSSARKAAEARCSGDETCLADAALVPLDVFVANRSPSSLLLGHTVPPQEYPTFYDSIPLTVGPSRVMVGNVKTVGGELESRVFVACYDSRRIFIYDPKRARIETEIFTGRGPHAMAVDQKRALLYVGHFTDSYVGVYSLDLGHPVTYGAMLATLGDPRPPRSSK
jgi:hypothetical protein